MRDLFPGYYRPTEEEFAQLWGECLFVLDANVLLNMYRYSENTRNEILSILEDVSDRLWIPHQAALEYHENRLEVILKKEKAYERLKELLEQHQNKFRNEVQKIAGHERHPFIDADQWLDRLDGLVEEIKESLDNLHQEHPDWLSNDPIRNELTELLDGKVGSPYLVKRLEEIYEQGKSRYKQDIPPGYKDANKAGEGKYGDLVMWFQIIEEARESKKPIIFITDDRKEDWWWKLHGKTIGPRPELVSEMNSKAEVSFYMYSTDPFMEHVRNYLDHDVDQPAIEEARKIREHDERHLQSVRNLEAHQRLRSEAAKRADLQRRLVESHISDMLDEASKVSTMLGQMASDRSMIDWLSEESIEFARLTENAAGAAPLPSWDILGMPDSVDREYFELGRELDRLGNTSGIPSYLDSIERTKQQATEPNEAIEENVSDEEESELHKK